MIFKFSSQGSEVDLCNIILVGRDLFVLVLLGLCWQKILIASFVCNCVQGHWSRVNVKTEEPVHQI